MAMLIYILAIFTGWLGPLIIWLIKKDTSPFVNHHGKELLNFEITVFIALIISGILVLVIVGCFLVPAIAVANLIFMIIGAVAANKGEYYRFPLTIRIIK